MGKTWGSAWQEGEHGAAENYHSILRARVRMRTDLGKSIRLKGHGGIKEVSVRYRLKFDERDW